MSDSNKNFQELRRLLKLKQHEVPPPGYHHQFSGSVIARIRAGESDAQSEWMQRLGANWPQLARLVQFFTARPGVIGGFATSVCLLLLIAVVVADRTDENSPEGMTASTAASGAAGPALASANLVPAENSGIAVSTNPIVSLQPVASLFGSQQNPLFQSAAFMPSGQ